MAVLRGVIPGIAPFAGALVRRAQRYEAGLPLAQDLWFGSADPEVGWRDAVTSQNPNTTTNTSLAVNMATAQVGDTLVVEISGFGNGTTIDPVMATPSGWTYEGDKMDSNGTPASWVGIYWRRVLSGDTWHLSSVTFSWTTQGQMIAVCRSFIGADPVTPLADVTLSEKVPSSTAYTVSITTTGPGWVVNGHANRTGSAWSALTDVLRETVTLASSATMVSLDTNERVAAGTYTKPATGSNTSVGVSWAYRVVAGAALAGTDAPAGDAAGVGTAYAGAPAVTPAPAEATGSGTAYGASVSVTVNPGTATGTGTASDAVVDSALILADGASGNSTSPTVTLPGTITEGMVLALVLMQNNTDVITGAPTELHQLDAITPTGGGQGASNLYLMTADATTAGSTLTWTLSATRNWAIAWAAVSGVEQDPLGSVVVFDSESDTVAVTSSFTTPSVSSGDDGFVLEFLGVKANGVALTDLGHPAGFTERHEQLASTGTFGSNVSVATLNGSPVGAGTYGGDTWTTSSTVATTFRYTIVLRTQEWPPAALGFGTAYDATVAVTAAPAEAVGTGVAYFDPTGGEVSLTLIADNPIYGFGTAYDATVTTTVATTATPPEAAGTGTAYDPALEVRPAPAEATGTGTAFSASVSVTVNPGAAAGTGVASDATVAVTFTPGTATGTGTGYDPVPLVTVYPAEALGTGVAEDGQVLIAGGAPAELAPGTGVAYGAGVSITVNPGEATGTGTGYDTTVGVLTPAGVAAGTGAGYDTTILTAPSPGEATGTGTAYGASVSVTVYPGTAYGTGTAEQVDPFPGGRSSVHRGHRTPPGVRPGSRGGPAVGRATRVTSSVKGGAP